MVATFLKRLVDWESIVARSNASFENAHRKKFLRHIWTKTSTTQKGASRFSGGINKRLCLGTGGLIDYSEVAGFGSDCESPLFNDGVHHALAFARAPLRVAVFAASTALAESPKFTHKQARSVTPVFEGQKLQLNTFCMGPDENLWLCCGGLPSASEASKGSILIYQPSGEFVRRIELDFVPQAINFTADGAHAFVAGSGVIAKLSASGEVVKSIPAPNILDEEELKKKLQAAQEKQLKEMMESFDEQIERLNKQLEKLNEQIATAKEKEDERGLKRAEARAKLLSARSSPCKIAPSK